MCWRDFVSTQTLGDQTAHQWSREFLLRPIQPSICVHSRHLVLQLVAYIQLVTLGSNNKGGLLYLRLSLIFFFIFFCTYGYNNMARMQARHLFFLWSFYFIFKNGSSAISMRKSTIRYTMLSEEKCCIMMPRGKYPQSSVFIVSSLGKKKLVPNVPTRCFTENFHIKEVLFTILS